MKPVLPGSAIGVLGSGQLGRMFAIAARQMGYRVHVLSPEADSPAGQVADLEVVASYDDRDAIRRFASGVSVATFEFENILAETAEALAERVPVRPDASVLHRTQNRIREKTFLRAAGVPVAPFQCVGTREELDAALGVIGYPAVLKAADSGYDGKGQAAIRTPEDKDRAWDAIGRRTAVLEAFVDFQCELSVVAARGVDGAFVHYGVVENRHRNHILDVTLAPARSIIGLKAETVEAEAVEIARTVMEQLGAVGVLCVEFFLTKKGKLLVNELAPRPHNSGHFTLDACVTSQFEQQVRAICGLPLGSTRRLQLAVMANLMGDLWEDGTPNWEAACEYGDVKLHLYGKTEARAGRKMGHLTALADTTGAALALAMRARESLQGRTSTWHPAAQEDQAAEMLRGS